MHSTVQKAVGLLQTMIERKRHARRWEDEFLPISDGALVRATGPDVRDPEVRLLLAAGLVSYSEYCSNDSIPDSSLRLRDVDLPQAEAIVLAYVLRLEAAYVTELK